MAGGIQPFITAVCMICVIILITLICYNGPPSSKRSTIVSNGRVTAAARDKDVENCNMCSPYDLRSDSSSFNYECVPLHATPSTPICLYPSERDVYVSKLARENSSWHQEEFVKMQNWLSGDPDMGLIDLGTNLGIFSLFVAAMGRNVLSVEPNMENVRHFHKSVNQGKLEDRITLLANAIGSENEIYEILYRDINQGATGMKQIQIKPDVDYSGENYTKVITMKDLVPFCKFKQAVLKIDVEGYEYRAFAEAEQLFANIHIPYVYMEWNVIRHFERRMGSFRDHELFYRMMNFFKQKGYLPQNPDNNAVLNTRKWREWPYTDVLWVKQQ